MIEFLRKGFLCVLVAGALACSRREAPPSLAQQLEGTWHLRTLGGRPLYQTRLAEWHIEFLKGGKYRFGGVLSGGLRRFKRDEGICASARWFTTATSSPAADPVVLMNPQQQPEVGFYTKFHAFGR